MNATHYIIENELNVSRSEEYIENLLEQKKHPELTEPPHKDNVVRLIKDVRFFLNTLKNYFFRISNSNKTKQLRKRLMIYLFFQFFIYLFTFIICQSANFSL